MGIIHPNRRTALARVDRWLMTGTRPSWTDGRPPACACRSSNAIPRPACTSGLWGNAGSRARTRRCSAGSGVGGGASSAVGRLRRIEVGAGKRAGRFRPSPGRGRWRGAGRAFPGGVVPVFEHALGGGVAGRDRGMRVPGSAGGVREDGHGAGVVMFDNAVGVGHRNADGTAARTRLFSLFCARYGFGPRFRDPYSGHGKGGVENAVGFRGARPDGADAVGRGLPGVGPRVARRHPCRGRRMWVRGHRQSGGDRHRRRTDHRPGRNRHMRPTRPRGQGLLGRPGSETP